MRGTHEKFNFKRHEERLSCVLVVSNLTKKLKRIIRKWLIAFTSHEREHMCVYTKSISQSLQRQRRTKVNNTEFTLWIHVSALFSFSWFKRQKFVSLIIKWTFFIRFACLVTWAVCHLKWQVSSRPTIPSDEFICTNFPQQDEHRKVSLMKWKVVFEKFPFPVN